MTLLDERVRDVGIDIGLWRVDGAAATTLVVASSRRLADPLPVLETAVASVAVPVTKVALAQPAGGGDEADSEYIFAQVVDRTPGRVLDLTPECGHSMLAVATHLHHRRAGGPGDGSVRLLTNRSERPRVVHCRISVLDGPAGLYGAGLSFPLDDLAGAFPLGPDALELDVGGYRLRVNVVDSGNPYAFADAGGLGITTAADLFSAGDDVRQLLRELRGRVAPLLGLADSYVLPKPALLVRGDDARLYVRALSADDWHPGLALTGSVAVAALSADAGEDADLTIVHPGGVSLVGLRRSAEGVLTLLVEGRTVRRVRTDVPGQR